MNRTIIALLLVLIASSSAFAQIEPRMPKPLKEGDIVAICCPSYNVDPTEVNNLVTVIEQQGWQPFVMPNTLSVDYPYAGSDSVRAADLISAMSNPDVKALICGRGGYGMVHILHLVDSVAIEFQPKWVVGFSDITALHSLLNRNAMMSIHGPMANTIYSDETSTSMLLEMLKGNPKPMISAPDSLNRYGKVVGELIGGNFAVLAELISTPFDMVKPGSILVIEDVDEPIYKIERILYQLKLSGMLEQLGGLVVGSFTGYKPYHKYSTMEQMIHDVVKGYDFPVMYNAPTGHSKINHPWIEGATVEMTVDENGGKIEYQLPNK